VFCPLFLGAPLLHAENMPQRWPGPKKAASVDGKSAIAPPRLSLRTKLTHRRTTSPVLLQQAKTWPQPLAPAAEI